jgi:hypothetical protein
MWVVRWQGQSKECCGESTKRYTYSECLKECERQNRGMMSITHYPKLLKEGRLRYLANALRSRQHWPT